MPTHHLSAASTRATTGSKCPCCVWAKRSWVCTFLGMRGEVPRVDPAVVQAGTWEQERQKSEACGL